MKKVMLVLGLLFLLIGSAGADIALDISGSQYETKTSDTMRIHNVTAPGYPGKYWVDFQWDPVNYIFVPININAEPAVDPLLAKTELLKGTWTFYYHVGTPSYTDIYTLNNILSKKNSEGGYDISGTSHTGDLVFAGYYPHEGNWALLHINSYLFDDFYVFHTDGSNVLSGSCYYLVYHSGGFSNCYSLSGSKTNLVAASENLSLISEEEVRQAAYEKSTQATEKNFGADIAAKYWSLKFKSEAGH